MKRSVVVLVALVAALSTALLVGGVAVWVAQDDDPVRPAAARAADGRAGPIDRGPMAGGGMMGGPMAGGGMMGGPMAGALTELDWLRHMVAHHEEAVDAAQELARSDRARMRAFGASIVETQQEQIDRMEGWLREWYPDEPTDVDYRPMMRDLSGLDGDELDRAFLEDMIGHHMMAVMPPQLLLDRGGEVHRVVHDGPRTTRAAPRAEIHQMRLWLWEQP
jgi:uncharacterized protein (DUF305 family)